MTDFRSTIWYRMHKGIVREVDMYLSMHWMIKVAGLLLFQITFTLIFLRFFGKTVRFFWREARGRR